MTDITQPETPRAPSNADRVAMAHQYTLDLENTNKALLAENANLRAKLDTSQHSLEASEAIRAAQEIELNYYKSRCTEIITMLRTAGRTILDAIRDPRELVAKYMPSDEQQRALERAVAGVPEPAPVEPGPEVPKFLQKGPSTDA